MLVCNLHSPPTYKNISKTIHKHIYIYSYICTTCTVHTCHIPLHDYCCLCSHTWSLSDLFQGPCFKYRWLTLATNRGYRGSQSRMSIFSVDILSDRGTNRRDVCSVDLFGCRSHGSERSVVLSLVKQRRKQRHLSLVNYIVLNLLDLLHQTQRTWLGSNV